MKTQEEVLEAVHTGARRIQTIDGRDFVRLVSFFDTQHWNDFGMEQVEPGNPFTPRPWTEEEVCEQLQHDVAFGFEKALGKRGISAGLMYEVVKLWLWVLNDPLQDMTDYTQYGLPLFRAVAVKYGFENPIGDHAGNEAQYSCD